MLTTRKFVLPLSQVDELVMFDENKLESFSGAADLFRSKRRNSKHLLSLTRNSEKKIRKRPFFLFYVYLVNRLGLSLMR